MKKFLLSIFFILLLASPTWASPVVPPADTISVSYLSPGDAGALSGESTFLITGTGTINDVMKKILANPGWANAQGGGVSIYTDNPGTSSGVSQYVFWANLSVGDGATSTSVVLLDVNETVRFTNNKYYSILSNATLQTGQLLPSGYGSSGGSIVVDSRTDTTQTVIYPLNGASGTFNVYGGFVGFGLYWRTVFRYGNLDVRNSVVKQGNAIIEAKNDLYFTNLNSCTIYDSSLLDCGYVTLQSDEFDFQDSYILNAEVGCYLNQNNSVRMFVNATIADSTVGALRVAGTGSTVYMIDPKFSWASGDIIIVNENNAVFRQHIVKLRIYNLDGDPISGATAYFVDRSGVSQGSAVSDTDGIAELENPLSTVSWFATSETTGYYIPYTITVEYQGKRTVEYSGVTIEDPIDWKIAMEPVQIRDNRGKLYQFQGPPGRMIIPLGGY